MPMKKCPTCDEYFYVPDYETDFIHKCIKSDKTRKTTRTEFWMIPDKINLKIDRTDHWNLLGMNISMPDKKLDRADIEKMMYEKINVDTMVEMDELED